MTIEEGEVFRGQDDRLDGRRVKNDDSADDVKHIDLTQVHYLSGPIACPTAEPGDLLKVEILDVGPLPGDEWGFTGTFHKDNGGGFLTDHYPQATKACWDFAGVYCCSRHIPGVKFAGLIHPGLIGTAPSAELLKMWNERESALVAGVRAAARLRTSAAIRRGAPRTAHRPRTPRPPRAQRPRRRRRAATATRGRSPRCPTRRARCSARSATAPPRRGRTPSGTASRGGAAHGARPREWRQLRHQEPVARRNLYLPVFVGANLSMGDMHFSQGDSEVSFCGAIEMSGFLDLRMTVIKGGMKLLPVVGPSPLSVNPIFEIGPLEPRYSSISSSRASRSTRREADFLDAPRRRCVLNCIKYLAHFGYTEEQTTAALVLPVRGRISGIVDVQNAVATGDPLAIFDQDVRPKEGEALAALAAGVSVKNLKRPDIAKESDVCAPCKPFDPRL